VFLNCADQKNRAPKIPRSECQMRRRDPISSHRGIRVRIFWRRFNVLTIQRITLPKAITPSLPCQSSLIALPSGYFRWNFQLHRRRPRHLRHRRYRRVPTGGSETGNGSCPPAA
jgi:hypothetical protein